VRHPLAAATDRNGTPTYPPTGNRRARPKRPDGATRNGRKWRKRAEAERRAAEREEHPA
jgi:hypothetical protein